MKPKKKKSAMKVCRTCRFWSDKHKGTCTRIDRGAGQFWVCDEWLEVSDDPGYPPEKGIQEGRSG
jgi:hypothetical protein